MLDVLIKNANIIDGTGKPAYKGSIGISGGKLVMADGSEEATAVIDASGKYVSPPTPTATSFLARKMRTSSRPRRASRPS